MLDEKHQALRLNQLQRSANRRTPIGKIVLPARGWIQAAREALGLSMSMLGTRLGITPQGVANLERSEIRRAIRLSDLDRTAAAMGCDVVYLFLPKSGRWENEHAAATHHSMELEGQGTRAKPER